MERKLMEVLLPTCTVTVQSAALCQWGIPLALLQPVTASSFAAQEVGRREGSSRAWVLAASRRHGRKLAAGAGRPREM
jgi:hypothetical protein